MLLASSDIMTRTGMFRTNEMIVAVTRSAPWKTDRAKKTPQASVAPTGAENTALKMVASSADASRTSPVLWRTKSCFSAGMTHPSTTPAPDRGDPDRNNIEQHSQRILVTFGRQVVLS